MVSSGAAMAQLAAQCGTLDNAYGPWDYTNAEHFRERLGIVEKAHFTPEVELLKGHNKCGNEGCQLAPDIDYTLRAFPNHHRALYTMARYHLLGMDQSNRPMRYSPQCYFDRALAFQPEDSTVFMIYGYYLGKIGKSQTALQQYEKALELAPDSAEAHYNAGLMYTENGNFEKARFHARRAYELGFPLPGLRRKLERAGEWQLPDSAEPVASQ